LWFAPLSFVVPVGNPCRRAGQLPNRLETVTTVPGAIAALICLASPPRAIFNAPTFTLPPGRLKISSSASWTGLCNASPRNPKLLIFHRSSTADFAGAMGSCCLLQIYAVHPQPLSATHELPLSHRETTMRVAPASRNFLPPAQQLLESITASCNKMTSVVKVNTR